MKKIVATLLISAMLIGSLASCAENQEDNVSKNTDNLKNDKTQSDTETISDSETVFDSETIFDTETVFDRETSSDGTTSSDDATTPVTVLNGIETAKLILANERLNSQLFKNTDSLFESGAKAFANLSKTADENMAKFSANAQSLNTVLAGSDETATSATEFVPDQTQTLSNGSVLEIDGNVYRWSNFGEYSNSYDYFLNLTNNVKSSAEIGAKLIDDTKKFIRIVDTWVKVENKEYYLHVEDDSETIYCRSNTQNELCRRYKRADGVNVYEIYKSSASGGSSRMVYIPGEKYEYSYILNSFNHNFTAENTKGFWEVVDVGQTDWGYNVSCMVLKDDICYDSFYDSQTGKTNYIKVISPDKSTDILDISFTEDSASIILKLQAFNGVDYVELTTDNVIPLTQSDTDYQNFVYRYDVPEDPKNEARTVYYSGKNNCSLVLENGLSLKSSQTFLDEKITLRGVSAEYKQMEGYSEGYISALELQVFGSSYDEIMKNLSDFLSYTGLECTRDFDSVKSGITQARTELSQMTKYHTWNESPIATTETLNVGYANNLSKLDAFSKMFDEIKDAEVVDFSSKDLAELKMQFAPITAQTATSVTNNKLTVTVNDLQLSVEDTLLFVAGEKYRVSFAIIESSATTSAGLNLIELEESLNVEYTEADNFNVTQTASFDIPLLAAGSYTLVAYISTEDGIRSSGYVPVIFTEVAKHEEEQDALSIIIDKKEDGTLFVTIEEISDVKTEVTLPEEKAPSYLDMYKALEEKAYLYGFVAEGAQLEISTDNGATWSALTGEETELTNGTYRLKYSIKNGENSTEGYVYTDYIQASDPAPDTDSNEQKTEIQNAE